MGCPSHTSPVQNCIGCRANMPRREKGARLKIVKRPTEHEEQVRFIAWTQEAAVLAQFPELDEIFAVPNGGQRNEIVAAKLKAEGVKRGVEDLVLLVARGGYHGLLIEMKRENYTPSDVKREQSEWHLKHIRRGFKVVVCGGCEEAQNAALAYLIQPVTKVVHREG